MNYTASKINTVSQHNRDAIESTTGMPWETTETNNTFALCDPELYQMLPSNCLLRQLSLSLHMSNAYRPLHVTQLKRLYKHVVVLMCLDTCWYCTPAELIVGTNATIDVTCFPSVLWRYPIQSGIK
jgi:hypothetical protein